MVDFFTRNGDDGYTGILGDERVPKYHPRTEAVGAIDEATAALGLARALSSTSSVRVILETVQRDLYHLMAEVAATPENAAKFRTIDEQRVNWLEEQISLLENQVDLPREFILPGDTVSGGAIDLGRTIVRRAERRVAFLLHQKEIENPALLQYLNRLSSLCFILELFENQLKGNHSTSLAKKR